MRICYLININSSQKSHPHVYLLPNQCKFELESHPHAYFLPNQYKFESANRFMHICYLVNECKFKPEKALLTHICYLINTNSNKRFSKNHRHLTKKYHQNF